MNGKHSGKSIYKYYIFAYALIVILVITHIIVNLFLTKNVQIAEVFQDSEVVNCDSSLDIAGRYATKALSQEQKETILYQIANELGLMIDHSDLVYSQHDQVSEVSIQKNAKSASTNLKMVSINISEAQEIPIIHNYILINLHIYSQIGSIMEYRNRCDKVFNELKVTERSCYLKFTGEYPGQLTLDGRNRMTDHMIKKLDGKVTYENRKDAMYTVYAYSGALRDCIKVGDSKVNIQVAMNYNEIKDCTVVYLATPVMNGSY